MAILLASTDFWEDMDVWSSSLQEAMPEMDVRVYPDEGNVNEIEYAVVCCLLYTSPSPRDKRQSRMPSSA